VSPFSERTFGLLIAYVIPGFVGLWGLGYVSPVVDAWLRPSPDIPGGIESLFFVSIASVAAGMTASGFRWALLDTLWHHTGLRRPEWDDGRLPERVQAFDVIVEAHYRHYLFYANTALAAAFAFALWMHAVQPALPKLWPPVLVFTATELVFLAAARDTLRKYYARTTRLLGLPTRERR
jgi:hypothetical protein